MPTEDLIKGITTSAEWLNSVVLFALGVAFVVLLLKFLGQDEIRVWGVTIRLKSIWIVFLALTVAHGVATIIHLRGASTLMFHPKGEDRSDPTRIKAWHLLTTSGPLVFRHVVKRAKVGQISFPSPFHPIEDPLALPTYIAAAGFCAAHVRWRDETNLSRAVWLLIGLFVTMVNWWIASWWVLGTAELPGSRDAVQHLVFFNDQPRKICRIT